MSPDKVFLLHVGDVLIFDGVDTRAATRRCVVDVRAVDVVGTLQKTSQAYVVLLYCSFTVNGEDWL